MLHPLRALELSVSFAVVAGYMCTSKRCCGKVADSKLKLHISPLQPQKTSPQLGRVLCRADWRKFQKAFCHFLGLCLWKGESDEGQRWFYIADCRQNTMHWLESCSDCFSAVGLPAANSGFVIPVWTHLRVFLSSLCWENAFGKKKESANISGHVKRWKLS